MVRRILSRISKGRTATVHFARRRLPGAPGAEPLALRLLLLLTAGVLWTECLAAALWLPVTVVVAVAAAALLGLIVPLPDAVRWLLVLATVAMVAALAAWRLIRLPRPTRAHAERRLERANGVAHRPISVLRDQPAGEPGPQAAALWARHQARAASAIARLRPPRPGLRLPTHDPLALRAAALLLLVAGIVVAGNQAPARLAGLFAQSGAAASAQGWITPPPYTGLAPLLLPPGGGEISAPAGSALTLTVAGASFAPSLAVPGGGARVHALGDGSWQADAVLTGPGQIAVGGWWRRLAAWRLTILPNEAPAIAWHGAPGPVENSLKTRLPWSVAQRWGVASLTVRLAIPNRPDLPAHRLTLPLPGHPKLATGAATPDLSSDPWAGLPVAATLRGTDVSGQSASSATLAFTLPARPFRDPLARAIADLRRRLALHPARRQAAADDLDSLGQAVPNGPRAIGVMLNLAATAALLREPATPAAADPAIGQAEDRLWTLALALDGALPDASERKLQAARDALQKAVQQHAPTSELEKRIEALRQALAERLRDLQREAERQGSILTAPPGEHALSEHALQRQLDKLEQAAKNGQTEEAEQRLAQLQKMLDRLAEAKPMKREDAQRAQKQAQEGRKEMGAMQDLVRRQTGLLDQAQARAATPDQPPQFQYFGDQPPDAPLSAADRRAQTSEARTQRALRRALAAAREHFSELGGKPPASLGDADRAMEQAARALAQGQDDIAKPAEQRAIAAMQKGGQNMGQQMAKQSEGQQAVQLGDQPQGDEAGGEEAGDQDGQSNKPGQGRGPRGRDPLGRRVTGNGRLMGDDPDLHVPETMEQGRSRAIQDELRRREEDRARPQQELDYIGRLLKPF